MTQLKFKTTVFLLLLLLLQFGNVFCQSKTTTQQKKSKQLPAVQQTRSFPKPVGYVNDFALLYTPEQTKYLNKLLAEFDDSTTIQIALVTLDSNFLTTQQFDDYTLRLANHWAVGDTKKNNGVLIGINPKIRYMRIQNGFGIEGILSDVETKKIIDSSFTPSFKEGGYYKGTITGIEALMNHLRKKLKK